MSAKNLTTRSTYVHPDDPANHIRPGEAFIVDGLDWSWAFCVFRPVPGYPAYCAGSNGTVWSCLRRTVKGYRLGAKWVASDQWKRLRPDYNNGYLRVTLSESESRVIRSVHSVILETFAGKCPPGFVGRHLNDDQMNNRITNLQWGTPRENMDDAVRNGRTTKGERNCNAKLTATDVQEIRDSYASGGVTQAELAETYSVGSTVISEVVRGGTWKHVGGPIIRTIAKKKYLGAQVAAQIRESFASGVPRKTLIARYGVDKSTVNRILRGSAWK